MAEDDGTGYVKKVAPIALILLAIAISFTYIHYHHPAPAADCSKPYIYPICSRAVTPDLHPQPPLWQEFLGTLLAAVLAVIIIYAGYHASVTEQTNIITTFTPVSKPTVQASSAVNTASPSTVSPVQPATQSQSGTKETIAPIQSNAPIKPAKPVQSPAAPSMIPAEGIDLQRLM